MKKTIFIMFSSLFLFSGCNKKEEKKDNKEIVPQERKLKVKNPPVQEEIIERKIDIKNPPIIKKEVIVDVNINKKIAKEEDDKIKEKEKEKEELEKQEKIYIKEIKELK
jgi:hypothetical protein